MSEVQKYDLCKNKREDVSKECVPAAYTEMINKAGISKSNFRVSYDRGVCGQK